MEEDIVKYVNIVCAVMAVASTVAAVTPSKTDNKVLDTALKFINILAVNVGKAKR